MITIKLPYKSTDKFQEVLKQLRKEYSSVVRYSFNRYHENIKQKDIRYSLNNLNNINHLNSWLQQCAIMEANQLFKRYNNNPNIIFGGRNNFINRCKNIITKEKFNDKRLLPLNVQGEQFQNGNRMFTFHVINDNMIEFKVNRKEHYFLKLPTLKKNFKDKLQRIEQLNEVVQKEKGYTYSIKLTDTDIYISYEEFKEKPTEYNDNRYIGIDLNPDTIGVAVLDNGTVIHTVEYSLKHIFNKILNEKLSSNSSKMKYYQNKLKFETIQISKSISKLAKHFNCKTVFIEDLKFKLSKEQKYNHSRNRKTRNLWKRELFVQNLTKRLNILNIKLYSVNPAYSSFIGNLQHDYTDAVNASIEIARRGFEYRILKNKNSFYPKFNLKQSLQHRWKEMGIDIVEDWKKFFLEVKNSKLKYRVSLDEVKYKFNVFKQNSSHKSMVLNYVFYD